jgi:hypothetical protein
VLQVVHYILLLHPKHKMGNQGLFINGSRAGPVEHKQSQAGGPVARMISSKIKIILARGMKFFHINTSEIHLAYHAVSQSGPAQLNSNKQSFSL